MLKRGKLKREICEAPFLYSIPKTNTRFQTECLFTALYKLNTPSMNINVCAVHLADIVDYLLIDQNEIKVTKLQRRRNQ